MKRASKSDICEDEEWRSYPEFPRYEVSSLGRVRGPSGQILKPHLSHNGYLRVKLQDNRKRRVNRMVCWAFHGPPPTPYHQCAHLDGNRQNNHVDNLSWKTPVENALDKRMHGTQPAGENHPCAVLNFSKVKAIRRIYANGNVSQRDLASRYGVSCSTIGRIIQGRIW
jgi:hypothetical protein